jgi:hypothetical protein
MTLFIIIVIIVKLLSDHKPRLKDILVVAAVALIWLLACSAFITLFILLNAKPR